MFLSQKVSKSYSRFLRRIIFVGAIVGFFAIPTHALTAAEIISRARLLINDTSADTTRQRFSDAQLLAYLNDGQREANAFSWVLRSSYTFSLTAGTQEYALPTNFLATWRVLLDNKKIDQTSLNELDANSVGWRTVTGKPQKYYIYLAQTTQIGFFPTPTSTSTGTVVVYLMHQPTELTATTQTPFDGWTVLYPYHSGLSYYIAYRCYMVQEQSDMATPYFNEWALYIQSLKEAAYKLPDFNPGLGGRRTQ